MKVRSLITAAAVVPAALAVALATGGAAHASPVPTGYAAEIGNIPVAVSAFGTGASAAVNPAGTLTLTPGSPVGTTYAKADLSLPVGSVLPQEAPTFTTSSFLNGSPRWVITLSNGNMLMDNQASSTVSGAADPFAADWLTLVTKANNGSGAWSNTLDTYSQAEGVVGGAGSEVSDAYIVADGDQAAGTADVLSDVQYGGRDLKVTPLYAAVPRLSQGHAEYVAPTREDVFFVQSGAASWDFFTIVGPGAINGHQGWVNGHLGLNSGVYSGLEAGHGYAVYYQPVTGPGSTTAVPGSHIGHVYFVSNSR
jgi:hypothetical protein